MPRLFFRPNILILLALILSFSLFNTPTLQAQTVLFSDSFDTSNNYVTRNATTFPECGNTTNFFTRTDGSTLSANYNVTGQDGSFFFAVQNFDDAPCSYPATPTQRINYLEFTAVSLSSLSSVDVSLLVAEDDSTLNMDWDTPADVRIQYRLDSGSYINLFCFAGGSTNNTEPGLDDNCDGTRDSSTANLLTSTFTEYSEAVNVSGASTIQIRIVFYNLDDPEEDIAIDLLQVIDPTATCFATPDNGTTVYNTVQEAVDAASADGTVKVAGTCTGIPDGRSAVITINKNITILGGYPTSPLDWNTVPTSTDTTLIDADSGGHVILIEETTPAVTADLYNLTLQNGLAAKGGGIYNDGNTVDLTDSFVTNNIAAEVGGGIATIGSMVISNSSINDNLVTSATNNVFGGGIAVTGNLDVINNSTISGNGADATGANSVAGGGGIYAVQSDVTITSATFDENVADATQVAFGGAIASAGTQSTITDTTFTQNFARHLGGAILNYAINVPDTIADMVIQGGTIGTSTLPNVAQYGGGIYNQYYLGIPGFPATYQTSLKLEEFGATQAVITNNRADEGGAGIFNNGGKVTATDTIITNNEVTNGGLHYGGGVFNTLGGDFIGTRVLLEANVASYGSAIHTSGNRDDTMRAADINSNVSSDRMPSYVLPIPDWYTENNGTANNDISSANDVVVLGDTVKRASTVLNESAIINNGSLTSLGGGGLYVNSAGDGTDARRGLTLTNVTISGHDISASGTNGAAGIEIASHPDGSSANVELNYVTITDNIADVASDGVGGLRSNSSTNTVVINNSILAFNTGDTSGAGANDCFSTATEVVSFGTYTSSGSSTECASALTPDDNLVLDPLNAEDVHPLTAGLAIDGAVTDCPSVPPFNIDQRNIDRPINGNNLIDDSNECDAGAYEAPVDTYNVSNTIINTPGNPQPNSDLISPIGQTADTTPLFQWKEADNATTYSVRLDGVPTGNPNVNSTVRGKRTLGDETFTASEICSGSICTVDFGLVLDAGVYQWQVKPDNGRGRGQWNAPATFQVIDLPRQPIQLSPQDTLTSITPSFTWQADTNVQWYRLWVADDNDTIFTQWYNMRDICADNICVVQPNLQLANGVNYRWQVQATKPGAYSNWAGPAFFGVSEEIPASALPQQGN